MRKKIFKEKGMFNDNSRFHYFPRIILSLEIIGLTGSITKTEGSGELKSGLLVFSDCMYFVFRVKIFHHPFSFFFLFFFL